MAANLFATIARKSITADEIVLIPAAYYHLVAGNSQLVHEHPPLSKLVAGLPLLLLQPNEARTEVIGAASNQSERSWGLITSFWLDNRPRFLAISFMPRIAAAMLTLILGVVVFLFARDLFGARTAVLSVFLFSLEPTVLAHGRVVHTDIPATLGFLLTCYTTYLYLKKKTWRRALLVGVASGVALISKFSMVLVAPMLVLVFLVLLWLGSRAGIRRKSLGLHAFLAILGAMFIVNAAYFFHSRPLTDEDVRWVYAAFPSSASWVWRSVRWFSHLLPTDFVLGVYWQIKHGKDGHPASLLGMYSQHGWWYYFPVAFALKTTLPFLILSVSSIGWAIYRLLAKRERLRLFLIIPLICYTGFLMRSPINIGVRYLLPAYPFLFIAGGALLDRLLSLKRRRWAGVAVVILLTVWIGFEAYRVYPDHMNYMNQLAWKQPRWQYLSDSNVEWGDDVQQLGEYLRARGETSARAVLLAGYMTLRFWDVKYIDATKPPDPQKPLPRYIAIGASFLNGSTVPKQDHLTEEQRINFFDAYRRQQPEAVFGGSIYLFRVND